MTQNNAAHFFNSIKQDQALGAKLKAAENTQKFMEIAKERGYTFTQEEIEHEISKLSEEEVASMINPGVAPRHHILPR